jgi:uncharacterized protein YjeT (DUF2065 family)
MPKEIYIALCLMVIFEGLLLFAVPKAWQKVMLDAAQQDPRRLRVYGGILVILGLIVLQVMVSP